MRIDARSRVVSLVLVKLFQPCLSASCLWQSPAGHVLLLRRVRGSLWHIASWSYGGGGRSVVLQTSVATSETEGIQGGSLQLWLIAGEVLWTRVLLKVVRLHLKVGIAVNC